MEQGGAAAGDDPFGERGLRGGERSLGAPQPFVADGIGRRADLDHGESRGQAGDPLLHDFDVAFVHGPRQLSADLGQSRRHFIGAAGALDERG